MSVLFVSCSGTWLQCQCIQGFFPLSLLSGSGIWIHVEVFDFRGLEFCECDRYRSICVLHAEIQLGAALFVVDAFFFPLYNFGFFKEC